MVPVEIFLLGAGIVLGSWLQILYHLWMERRYTLENKMIVLSVLEDIMNEKEEL